MFFFLCLIEVKNNTYLYEMVLINKIIKFNSRRTNRLNLYEKYHRKYTPDILKYVIYVHSIREQIGHHKYHVHIESYSNWCDNVKCQYITQPTTTTRKVQNDFTMRMGKYNLYKLNEEQELEFRGGGSHWPIQIVAMFIELTQNQTK